MQCAAQLGPAAALLLATSPLVAGSATAALFFITLGMGMTALSSSECGREGVAREAGCLVLRRGRSACASVAALPSRRRKQASKQTPLP